MKLNPSTKHSLSTDDLNIVLELSKVGYVKILSHQVHLISDTKKGIHFREYADEDYKDCFGLQIPENWYIEHIDMAHGDRISIIFGIKELKETKL